MRGYGKSDKVRDALQESYNRYNDRLKLCWLL